MFRTTLAAIAICLSPVVASAAPVTYTCEFDVMTEISANGWLPPEVVFQIDEAAGKATVVSVRRSSEGERPRSVRFRKRANGKYVMRWTLKNMPARRTRTVEGLTLQDYNTTTSVSYFASLNPKNMQLVMRASTGGSTETYNGTGACRATR